MQYISTDRPPRFGSQNELVECIMLSLRISWLNNTFQHLNLLVYEALTGEDNRLEKQHNLIDREKAAHVVGSSLSCLVMTVSASCLIS